MDPMEISDSQVKSYRRCPRRWGYEKLLKISPQENKDNLIMGDAVHQGCELFMPTRDLKAATEKALETVNKGKPTNIDLQRLMVPAMLYGWASYWVPKYDAEFTTVKCEDSFSVSSNELVQLRGKIDLTSCKRIDNSTFIWDYKTSSASYANDLTGNINHNQQLCLYAAQHCRRFGAWPSGVGLVFLGKPKTKDPVLASKQCYEDATLYKDARVQVTPAFAKLALHIEAQVALYGQQMLQFRELYRQQGMQAFDYIPADFEACEDFGSTCGFADGCRACRPLHTTLTLPKKP